MKDHHNIAGNSRTCDKHTEVCMHFTCQIASKEILWNLKDSRLRKYTAKLTGPNYVGQISLQDLHNLSKDVGVGVN